MKGFFHPLSPQGKSGIVDTPPWNYGAEIIGVSFKADKAKVSQWLPEGLQLPADEEDSICFAWTREIISVSSTNPDTIFENPARSKFLETFIAIVVEYNGEKGIYVPAIWVDKDFSLIRGWHFGIPKKIGNIYMSKYHPLMPNTKPFGQGTKLRGITERHGDKLVDMKIELERIGEQSEFIKHGIGVGDLFQVRHFPSITGEKASLNELIRLSTRNGSMKDFWVGKGELLLGESENEELQDFTPKEVMNGFYAQIGWTQPEDVNVLKNY
jgi:acetoacetate decarboxylase